MKLADYLAEPGRSATSLAADCAVAVSTISRAAKGSVPDRRLMQLIYDKTGGAVTPNDFFGIGVQDADARHETHIARSSTGTSSGKCDGISGEAVA